MKIVIAFCLIFTFTACDFEPEINLGNDYFLFGNKANTAIVKKIPEKRASYNPIILGEIVDYDFDDKYILIYRKASEKSKVYFGADQLWQKQLGMDTLQYWIIVKKSDVLLGPLQESEYLLKRNALRISENLKVNR